jgi:hypothetical protein
LLHEAGWLTADKRISQPRPRVKPASMLGNALPQHAETDFGAVAAHLAYGLEFFIEGGVRVRFFVLLE